MVSILLHAQTSRFQTSPVFIVPLLPTRRSCGGFAHIAVCQQQISKEASLEVTHTTEAPPIPAPLHNTTIYHAIPAHPQHLPPPIIAAEQDVYLLSTTLSPPPNQLFHHARFSRTPLYLKERRFKRRLSRSSSRPLSPRKPIAENLTLYKNNLITFGPTSSAFSHNRTTLVTKGPTSISKALNITPELESSRPSRLHHLHESTNETLILATTRPPTKSFLVQVTPSNCITHILPTSASHTPRTVTSSESFIPIFSLPIWPFAAARGPGYKPFTTLTVLPRNRSFLPPASLDRLLVSRLLSSTPLPNGLNIFVTGLATPTAVPAAVLQDARMGFIPPGVRSILANVTVVVEGETVRAKWTEVDMPTPVLDATFAKQPVGIVMKDGRHGLDEPDSDTWWAKQGQKISAPVSSPDGAYVSVLLSEDLGSNAAVCIFEAGRIGDGPCVNILLPEQNFGGIGCATNAVWAQGGEWHHDAYNIVPSAYEIFAEKGWNDIDSSFSSLGIFQ